MTLGGTPAPQPATRVVRSDSATILRAVRLRIRSAAYLRKWIVLGAVIGVISGLGAALFFVALDLGTRFFLGALAGFTPASPLGEGARPITDATRPWAIPLVVALGGLLSGIIVFRLAPEAEGHGTDAAIAAFHHGARRIRARIPLVKLVASAITIGSGGSGGREGPTAQIGAGFGSFLARLLDLDARDARIAVSTGMGAGIGAIFRAPLGGAVLAVEIPYREDVEADALVPAFVGSIVAYSIFGAIVGFAPIFGRVAGAGFTDPRQLAYYALIGLAAGIVGRLYIGGFYGLTRWFRRWTVPRAVRPAIAGFAVGCIGLVLPGVLGTGYGWVQAGLDRPDAAGSAPVGRPGAPVREDPGHVPVDRFRRVRRHLRSRHGHRRPARSRHLATPRTDRAGSARGSVAVRHRGDDGAVRERRPCAARRDAHGRRDDRQPGHARPGDARDRDRDPRRRRSLDLRVADPEPGRVARAPILVRAAR